MMDTNVWESADEALRMLRTIRSYQQFEIDAGEFARLACSARAVEIVLIRGPVYLRSDPQDVLHPPRAEVGTCDARVDVLPLTAAGHPVGILRVLGDPTSSCAVAATVAFTLGAVLGLVTALDRALAHRAIVASLGIPEPAESPMDLVRPGVVVALPRHLARPPAVDTLSPRQHEVLDLLRAGYTNAEIAERLVVSIPTVKTHVRAVLQTCGAVNRADAITRLALTGEETTFPGRPREATR